MIVAVDEVLDRREDSERIKNLSTASYYKTEAKNKDKVESIFFGKFILCTNNEHNFIMIDEKEIRYWVRKVPTINNRYPDFEKHLKDELEAFVSYIANRDIVLPRKTRMWFTKEQLKTEALEVLVRGTKYSIEKEMILLLQEMFEDFKQDTILSYTDALNY